MGRGSKPVGVRLDILRGIINDLEANERIRQMLGEDPLGNIGVFSLDNDFQFFIVSKDKSMPLRDEKEHEVFLDVVHDILAKAAKEGQ